jgi:hypothetical protein
MGESIDEIRRNSMGLPLEARTDLAYEGLDSMDDQDDGDPAELGAAWAAEIERRVAEIRNGTAETYALEDVLAEMEERYG